MSLTDRRGLMRMAIGAALVPVFASQHAQALAGQAIAPPREQMIYRRILERDMAYGYSITITRSFAIRFERAGEGFRVDGAQISAKVEAPENIASFARLEEERVETGTFPLLLDASGRIISGPRLSPAAQVTQAIEEARDRLHLDGQGGTTSDEVRELFEIVHQAGARMISYLPEDLFVPDPQSRSEEEEFALPWGETGSVRTVFSAERDPETRLMRHARREVITSLSDDRRHSVEKWDLAIA